MIGSMGGSPWNGSPHVGETHHGAMPVTGCEVDFFLLNQTYNGPDIPKQLRMLPYPADVRASKSLGDHQHVFFPLGIKTTSLFPPLQIPVPNTGEDEKAKAQLAKRYAETSYCAIC